MLVIFIIACLSLGTIELLRRVFRTIIQLRKKDAAIPTVEVKLENSHQSVATNDAVSLASSCEEPEQHQESLSPPPTAEDHAKVVCYSWSVLFC